MAGPRASSLYGYIPAPAGSGPEVAPRRRGILSELENLSYGIGEGQVSQLEGYEAMIRQPAAVIAALYRAASNPRQTITAMAADAMQKARGGPIGIGQLLGEGFSPRSLLGVNAATTAMNKPGLLQELDVYHGTPHRFPATEANPLGEFDASKIGTGEGAQAYGHGIYYAETPEVAKGYKPRDEKAEAKLMKMYGQAEQRRDYESMEVLESALLRRTASELAEQYPQQKALINRIGKINEKAASSLYKADLPDEMVDRMLDWDKPLSEQPAAVREALKRRITSVEPTDKFDMGGKSLLRDNRLGQYDKTRAYPWILEASSGNGTSAFGLSQKDVDRMFGSKDVANLTGEQIISRLAQQQGGQAAASKYLADLGIPGIRYLDAGSRDGGSGTRNFVVFPGEEKRVRILKRE